MLLTVVASVAVLVSPAARARTEAGSPAVFVSSERPADSSSLPLAIERASASQRSLSQRRDHKLQGLASASPACFGQACVRAHTTHRLVHLRRGLTSSSPRGPPFLD
jgi:hypothetical protein